jgi:hypothetical protein
VDGIWYHGSPLQLTVLLQGSTITQDRRLAEVFSHKPAMVSIADDGSIKHTGTEPGYLYRISEEIGPCDVHSHPRSSVAPGMEWITDRDLRLELIGPTQIVDEERLTEGEIAALRQRWLISRP